MGKRIIQRARGAGGPRYRAPSHRYAGKISYPREGTASIVDIIHDPARDAPLAVLKLPTGSQKLVIAAEGVKVGDSIEVGNVPPSNGNVLPLAVVPKGAYLFAIENNPGYGPQLCNGAGSHAVLISQEPDKVIIQLPSRAFKSLKPTCLATVGIAAGGGREDKPFVKAGQGFYAAQARNRLWPRSSACKMNPVDHPFGGKTKPGTPKSISRWAPPGAKVGSVASRRTGWRKK
jgi:large subunit ribosomal protein L2